MIDLTPYKSPEHERSFFKNIPIEYLEEVQLRLRSNVNNFRYVFRGPRYDSMRVSTRKAHATGFSIYITGYHK